MTRAALLLLAVLSLGVQGQTPEAYPGQHDHEKPPEGWYCEPQTPRYTIPPDHVCACRRMEITEVTTGECVKNPDGSNYVTEDPKCAVWCHKDHCKCPTMSCDTN